MRYCAYCGAQIAPGTQACPRCGRPPFGPAPRVVGLQGGVVALVLVAAGLGLVAVAGIVAALVIPNFLDALQKAKQKRTVADLRAIGVALESYHVDHFRYPYARNMDELAAALVPEHAAELPRLDGWQGPYRYVCLGGPAEAAAEAEGCESFRLASAGRDGTFEHEDLLAYEKGTFPPAEYDRDVVFGDAFFIQYPASPGS